VEVYSSRPLLTLFFYAPQSSVHPHTQPRGPWPRNRQREPRKLIKDCVSLLSPSIPIISPSLSLPPGSVELWGSEIWNSHESVAPLQTEARASYAHTPHKHRRACSCTQIHSQIFKFINFLNARNNKFKWMELALQWKISPEMKKETTWQNEIPWLLLITLLTLNTTPFITAPPSSFPAEQNPKSNNRLKERWYVSCSQSHQAFAVE